MKPKLPSLSQMNSHSRHQGGRVKIESISRKDIAVIGMACRFAEAGSVDQFWHCLCEGRDCIRKIPAHRKNDYDSAFRLFDPLGGAGESLTYLEGGYLENIDKFDNALFSISPREARLMDPNQRLFLECSWAALEDAGYGGKTVMGSRTGVYVGYSSDGIASYSRLISAVNNSPSELSLAGNIKSIIASRISYIMDFKGPSLLVDTACSSALLAVHLACQGIRNRECEMAIAGGVNINLNPLKSPGPGIGIESPDGKTRAFADNSHGAGFGEGVGALLLKPLNKAKEDRDHIYAVIKGSAVNQDGNTIGITAPDPNAQADVITKAWEDGGIAPETITYIEAHGTGTQLGDPIEIKGIQKAFDRHTQQKQFCAVGSVKTNIGHLNNNAGTAGIIKAILALRNKQLPPTLYFEQVNREINFETSPVYVNDRLIPWTTPGFPRRCGVSSFGLSGTNCHVVLEEYPVEPEIKQEDTNDVNLFTLSAKNKESLKSLIRQYRELMVKNPPFSLEDMCFTANSGRRHHNCRVIMKLKSKDDFREKLEILFRSELENLEERGIFYREQEMLPGKGGSADAAGESINEPDFSDLLNNNNPGALDRLCREYIMGGDIDWEALYRSQERSRVSLPAYHFMSKRFWIESPEKEISYASLPGKYGKAIDHPLLDYLLVESLDRETYCTEFRVKDHWVLNEHRVMGNCVITGTTFLEMIRAICQQYYPGQIIEITDVVFSTPLVVKEGEAREVQTIIKKERHPVEFVILSRDTGSRNWVEHTRGYAGGIPMAEPPILQLEEIKRRCHTQPGDEIAVDPVDAVRTGPRWDTVKHVDIGSNEALAYLELSGLFIGDLNRYNLHPALMDCAVNIAICSIGQGLYLPFSYKKLKIYRPMPAKIYSYLRNKDKVEKSDEIASFDIHLTDIDGNTFLEIEGYHIKKVHEDGLIGQTTPGENIYHEIAWISCPLENETHTRAPQGITLVLGEKTGIREKLCQRLQDDGQQVVEVEWGNEWQEIDRDKFIISGTPGDYQKLIAVLNPGQLTQILHLFTLSPTNNNEIPDLHQFKEQQKKGLYSLFYLTRAIIDNKIRNQLDVVLISNCAHRVTGEETGINPLNAALFGLGKVVRAEYPHISCRCVDIDEHTPVDSISREISAGFRVYLAAYRGSQRYIEEFGSRKIEKMSTPTLKLKQQGVYIITGGTGGIGLEIGKYLAGKNRTKLALINRSAIPPREKWDQYTHSGSHKKISRKIKAIKDMEDCGAEVICLQADVADENQIKPVIQALRDKYGTINGIVHSAGIAGDGFIIRKDEQVFQTVLSPKLEGTWLLDRLTQEDQLDFFVMFSSIASLTGEPGQGDYTAANSYLDSFTDYRNKKGKKSITINWPPWKETGMAVEYGANSDEGIFKAIPTNQAITVFENVLNTDMSRIIIGELNYQTLYGLEGDLPIRLSESLKSELREKGTGDRKKEKTKRKKSVPSWEMVDKDHIELSQIESIVAQMWVDLLELESLGFNDRFDDLGGDSIFAVSLLREMEKAFPGILDIADIFTYQTVADISQYIAGRLKSGASKKESPEPLKNPPPVDADTFDHNLDNVLNRLAKGEISISEADQLLE